MKTKERLAEMIEEHYENEVLMALKGEIYWDDELSEAEVAVSERFLNSQLGRGLGGEVYLPCAGTLRHLPPLKRRGVKRVVAVDLAEECLVKGQKRYRQWLEGVKVVAGDIREVARFLPGEGFATTLLLGNSLGDVVDLGEHMAFLEALARALRPGGVLLFDYVADRYNPPEDKEVVTQWEDCLVLPGGEERPVIDRRSRRLRRIREGVGVLEFSCQIVDRATGEVLVSPHSYFKLAVSPSLLAVQFEQVGLRLIDGGPIIALSEYHRRRVRERNDLGMLGEADHLYLAVKEGR